MTKAPSVSEGAFAVYKGFSIHTSLKEGTANIKLIVIG